MKEDLLSLVRSTKDPGAAAMLALESLKLFLQMEGHNERTESTGACGVIDSRTEDHAAALPQKPRAGAGMPRTQ